MLKVRDESYIFIDESVEQVKIERLNVIFSLYNIHIYMALHSRVNYVYFPLF